MHKNIQMPFQQASHKLSSNAHRIDTSIRSVCLTSPQIQKLSTATASSTVATFIIIIIFVIIIMIMIIEVIN